MTFVQTRQFSSASPLFQPRIAVLVLVVASLAGSSRLVHADEGSCAAGNIDDCVATDVPAASPCSPDDVIEKTTNCVSNSENYISCVTKGEDGTGAANCACLGQAPDVQACLGPCYAQAKEGLCEGADAATLVAASGPGLDGAEGEAEEKDEKEDTGPEKKEEEQPACNMAEASELLQTCMPKDLAVLQCLQSGEDQCECFKKASVLIDCLGGCFPVIVNGVCPEERVSKHATKEEEEEEEDVTLPCDDTDAADRLKACATKDTNFGNCMFADESGEGECSCLLQSPATLTCFGRCKEAILTGLECPSHEEHIRSNEEKEEGDEVLPAGTPCDTNQASSKLITCAKEDAKFVTCLKAGGKECDCITSAPVMLGCLGNCATAVINSIGCNSEPVDAASGDDVATAMESNSLDDFADSCDEETAKLKLKVCAREDATYADCLATNANDVCHCLPNHPATHDCMGECLGTIVNEVLKCDWSADADAIPECDKESAAEKLQECAAKDPEILACLKSDKLYCDCIAASDITMDCLQNCLDLINESLDCPLYGSPPSPPPQAPFACDASDAGNCCEADAAPKLQECAKKDATMVACLKSGTPACTCLSNSEMTIDCLGKCLDTINVALECPKHGSNRPAVPHTEGCTSEYAAKKLEKCAADDLVVLNCFKVEADAGKKDYQCGCLQMSDEMQHCLAGCAPLVGKSLKNCLLGEALIEQQRQQQAALQVDLKEKGETECDRSKISENLKSCVEGAAAEPNSPLVKCLKENPNSKRSECMCMTESTFVHTCLGPACWPEVQRSICEDVEEEGANEGGSSGGSGGSGGSSGTSDSSTLSSETTSVEQLLANVALVDLWPVLRGEDVTDIETLADLTREDFKSMGISVGKASKIMRAVKKLQAVKQ